MSDIIDKKYFIDNKNRLFYANNWYDDLYLNFDEIDDCLNVFNNSRVYSNFNDGENFSTIEDLFCSFLNNGQWDIYALIKKLDLSVDNYLDYTYANDDIVEQIENKEITNLSELADDYLLDFLNNWFVNTKTIPAWIFTDTEILAKDFPYYSTTCSLKNYSSAGDTYWYPGDSSEDSPDSVFWIDRKTFDNVFGTPNDSRYNVLEQSIKLFENWANGEIYGLTISEWNPEKDCWEDEEHIGRFIGEDYYSIEKLIEEEHIIIESSSDLNGLENLDLFSKKPFRIELNDGIIEERNRQKEFLDKQPKLFSNEELDKCNC